MFSVQLCDSAPCTPATLDRYTSSGEWVFEEKFDGLRAVLVCNNGAVRIWNRSGNEITHQWPEIVEAAKVAWPDRQVILDGELVVNDSDGRPNFKLTATRGKQTKTAIINARAEASPGNFHAFDLLYLDGADWRKQRFIDRRNALVEITENFEDGTKERIFHHTLWANGRDAMRWVLENKAEGLIIKRLNSTYQAGRRSDWVKVKPTFTVSCVVTGYDGGEGARAESFGALKLALIDSEHKLVKCGRVGTGFKQADLDEIVPLLIPLQNGLTSLDDTFVVEVEYQNFTEDGALRFPVYRGIRSDQTVYDCTLDQVLPQVQEATQ